MTTLPPRPYKVSPAYARKRVLTALGCFLLGAASLVGSGFLASHEAKAIHEDQALWESGVIADDARVSGRETSHEFIINSYELTTAYRDDKGTEHHGTLSFDLLFSSIANGSEVMLKYDPAHPERHTVSWAVAHIPARWGFVGLVNLGIAGFGLLLVGLGIKNLGMLSHARLVAGGSDEVALEVVSMKPILAGRRHTSNVYEYVHAGKRGKQQLPVKEVPLFTDEKRTHLVALVCPSAPDRPFLVRADHAPFEQ